MATSGESTERSQTSPTEPTSSSGGRERRRFNLKDEMIEVRDMMEGTNPPEERLDNLHKKYMNLVRDYKRLERRLAEMQKKNLEVAQHRDIIQNEVSRVTAAKTKLEGLCRELQRHNKQVVEDSRSLARDEEEKRREIADKFQSTIDDITTKMHDNHQKNTELKIENTELISKLKKLIEQYEAREKHFEDVLKHKQLELQLCEAKLAQQMVAIAETKESNMAERQYLLAETLEKQKKCQELTEQEMELKGQLLIYSEKFDDFQKTLTKSNEVFSTFKKEMDKMSKTIGQLEKEATMWKTRYEKCNRNLLEMAEERIRHEEIIKGLKGKIQKLEKLCRALQTERNQLNHKLQESEKEKNVDESTTPEEPQKDNENSSENNDK